MEIHVQGRTWRVEEREAGTLIPEEGERYFALHFRPDGGGDDEGVEMRWIPRPPCLTHGMAGRLFLLAGERIWRDPRDGALHRVLMEAGAWPGDEEPGPTAPAVTVRFLSEEASVSTAYDLRHPLGLAATEELTELLDRAAGRPVESPIRAVAAAG